MKITEEQFEEMRTKYAQEVRAGKPAQGSKGDINDQTNWISYSKEDLMRVLGQDGVTGVKFNFTEYTLDVAKELHGSDAALYVGRLNLVYSPLYTENERGKSEAEFYDRGTICPPTCQ